MAMMTMMISNTLRIGVPHDDDDDYDGDDDDDDDCDDGDSNDCDDFQ